jgi:hypothetical protein
VRATKKNKKNICKKHLTNIFLGCILYLTREVVSLGNTQTGDTEMNELTARLEQVRAALTDVSKDSVEFYELADLEHSLVQEIRGH